MTDDSVNDVYNSYSNESEDAFDNDDWILDGYEQEEYVYSDDEIVPPLPTPPPSPPPEPIAYMPIFPAPVTYVPIYPVYFTLQEVRRRLGIIEECIYDSPPPQRVEEIYYDLYCDEVCKVCGCNKKWSCVLQEFVCICDHCFRDFLTE